MRCYAFTVMPGGVGMGVAGVGIIGFPCKHVSAIKSMVPCAFV